MVFLLRILAFLGVLWMLKWLIAAVSGKPVRPAGPKPEAVPPTTTVKDPVCGMYMDPRLAVRHHDKTGDLYFCSETCRARYLDSR